MFRVAVIYSLIFTLSAGQAAFCCCALKSIAATFHAYAEKSTSIPAQTSDPCPHCKKKQDERSSPPEKTPAQDKGQHDGCPCKEHGPAATLSDAVVDHARVSLPDQFLPDLSVPGLSGVFSPDLASMTRLTAPSGLRDGPWLTPSDLLTTHHVIRC